MGADYRDKRHGVKLFTVYIYNQNIEDIKNSPKLQILIKYSILQIFPKFQLEQKLEQLTFVLLVGLKLPKHHFQGEISDFEKGAKYTKMANFASRFFSLVLSHTKTKVVMIASQLETIPNPRFKVHKQKADEKALVATCSWISVRQNATKWRPRPYRVKAFT